MSIEERAYKQYPPHQNAFTEELRSKGRAGYIKGARAQRDIDIKKACTWLKDNLDSFVSDYTGEIQINSLLNELGKAMKED